MLNFDEYKKISEALMKNVFEIESLRRIEVKKIIEELSEIGETSKLSNPTNFAELLDKLSELEFIDDWLVKKK